MKDVLCTLFVTAIPISCFVGAAFLAYKEKAGWGWLIFAGILIGGNMSVHIN